MALANKALVDLFSDLKTEEAVTAVLKTPAGQAWLTKPLSKDTPDNGLTYMIDGYFSDNWKSRHKEFVTAALKTLEETVPDADTRVSLLTSANERGQTPIHKSLAYGGALETYDPVLDALYKWAGEEKADAIMKDILSQPLGKIDRDISYAFQNIREMRQRGTPEYEQIDALTVDMYHPVTAAGLRATLKEIRPAIAEWLAQEKPNSDYTKERKAKMQDFYDSPDPVTEKGTLLTERFPSKAFFRLLEIHLKGDAATSQQKADGIFSLLSKRDAEGNTPMHIEWTVTDLLGTPKNAGPFTDKLSPILAAFDRILGTPIAIDLSVKLLLQENAAGQLPLDIMQYPKLPVRDFALDKMLQTLRKEMGSTEKFVTYVKEVIAPVLPADYKINLAAFEPEQTNDAGSKPKRGAKLDF